MSASAFSGEKGCKERKVSAGQKNGQSDQKRNVKKRRSKYGKNRNGFSSLKENWTRSTGSSG
jgi:hypothetical protein